MTGFSADIMPPLAFAPWAGDIIVRHDSESVDFYIADSVTVEFGSDYVEVAGGMVLGDVKVEPLADFGEYDIGIVFGDFNIDNVWYLDADFGAVAGTISVSDSDHVRISADYASEFEGDGLFDAELDFETLEEFEIEESERVIITIDEGDVEGDVVESEHIDVETGSGDDSIYVADSFDFSVDTNAGADYVSVHDGSGVVLTGSGNDDMHLHDAQVAFNPGSGQDEVDVIGGQTIGNGVDGYRDVFTYDLEEGGGHTIIVDEFDMIFIDAGPSGQWTAEQLDAIDIGGEDGHVSFAGLTLDYYVEDMFGGKG